MNVLPPFKYIYNLCIFVYRVVVFLYCKYGQLGVVFIMC